MAQQEDPPKIDRTKIGIPKYREVEIAKLQLQAIIDGLKVQIVKEQLKDEYDPEGIRWEFIRQLQFRKMEAEVALKDALKTPSKPCNLFDRIIIRLYLWATSNQSVTE